MNTKLRRLPQTMIAACAIVFTASSAFGLGGDYPNDQPALGNSEWPDGMKHLVNSAQRVHGFFAGAQDVFFYSGNGAEFAAFLLEYSKIDPIQKHVLIIHDGPGKAMAGVPCDWGLCGSWATQAMLHPKDPNASLLYILEVHFWTRGKIDLKQVTVPKNIELRTAGPNDTH